MFGDDRSLAVERVAERIDDATNERVAHRHAQELAGGFDLIAFGELDIFAEDDDADGILFEVEGQTADAGACELEHLAGHGAAEPVNARDAVADLEHAADLADARARLLL